jgi:hypothetical protein
MQIQEDTANPLKTAAWNSTALTQLLQEELLKEEWK